MTEIKNIPNHWQVKKLGEVCEIVSGNTPKGLELISNNGDFQFYKVSDMNLVGNEIGMNVSNLRLTIEEIKRLRIKIYPKGTIIFPKRGGAILTNKKRILSQNSSFDLNLMGVIPNDKVSSYFLYYWFQKLDLSKIYDGSNVPQINNKNVAPLEFPVPSQQEQQLIVSKIEELLSDLENGKQQLLLAQQQLKVYRQSLLKWAFEGKLTNENVKNGELPEGWKWVKFGELFKNNPQNGLYKPSTEYGSGIPILRIDGFYDGIILNDYRYKRVRLTEEEAQKYLLSINDIVVNRVNSMSHLGKCGLVKTLKEQTVFESNVMKIQIKKEIVFPKYITYYLACSKGIKELVKNAKHAVNQASINQTDVANAIIPLGPLEEQQHIVDELESKLTVCDKIEETISQSLLQAETLKQSILKKAFEGKLT